MLSWIGEDVSSAEWDIRALHSKQKTNATCISMFVFKVDLGKSFTLEVFMCAFLVLNEFYAGESELFKILRINKALYNFHVHFASMQFQFYETF